jgi:hypothetical protein
VDKAAQLIKDSEVSSPAFLAAPTGIKTPPSSSTASNQIQEDVTAFEFASVTAESRIRVHAYGTAAQPRRRL